ncbi:MAG: twin-arginine translocase TatA/TatE family subunit [Coriobacteriia bacterium]|jgi:sec-independent protein translocase protein TatA|nr:twin-arginine translocase TatA/TatE family subunit [Coriobacteriia bacterium]
MAAIFGLGPMEIGLVAIVVLVLFGPKRLPQLGKSLGKTVKAIREGVDGKLDEDEEDPTVTKAKSTDADDEV